MRGRRRTKWAAPGVAHGASVCEPRVDSEVTLAGGRRLAYAEWGDESGRPIVFFHGGGGSRLLCPDERATLAAGVRLITIDRPGCGGSDRHPRLTLLDWVDDYAEFCRLLALPPTPILGWSSGCPWALACAARLPERVPRLGLAAAVAPLDELPASYHDQLPPEFRQLTGRAREDRSAAAEELRTRFAWRTIDPVRKPAHLDPEHPDTVLMGQPPIFQAMECNLREGVRQGVDGYVDGVIAECLPWRFSVSEIKCETHLWWGDLDKTISLAETAYLAQAIPNCVLTTYPGEGHLITFSHWGEMLAALS